MKFTKLCNKRLNKLNLKSLLLYFLVFAIFLLSILICVSLTVRRIKLRDGFKNYASIAISFSDEFNIEPSLTLAIMHAESGFNEKAISNKGACGLMQLMPTTAAYVADLIDYDSKINLFDANCNAYLACAYLNYLFNRFDNEKSVICAYNAGEGSVQSWLNNEKYAFNGKLKIIPFNETQKYFNKVKKLKSYYAKII